MTRWPLWSFSHFCQWLIVTCPYDALKFSQSSRVRSYRLIPLTEPYVRASYTTHATHNPVWMRRWIWLVWTPFPSTWSMSSRCENFAALDNRLDCIQLWPHPQCLHWIFWTACWPHCCQLVSISVYQGCFKIKHSQALEAHLSFIFLHIASSSIFKTELRIIEAPRHTPTSPVILVWSWVVIVNVQTTLHISQLF